MSIPWTAPPARFLSGVTNQPRKTLFGAFPLPSPMTANIFFTDFNQYAAGDWTVTTTNSGTSALTAINGGALLITPGGTATNFQGNTLVPASFAITPGYKAWFGVNMTVSSIAATASPSFIVGLTNGGPSAPTDGIYFTKASGAAATTVSGVVRASSASTTVTGVATPVSAVNFTLGWFYDGQPSATIYFFSSAGVSTTAFSSQPVLGPQIYMVQPTTVAAPTVTVDWMFAAAELSRS